eukprot:2055936-Lingulodinium_polyedra.AAC.1
MAVRIGSGLLRATLRLLHAVADSGGFISLEHPEDPGRAPFPSIWALPEVAALESAARAANEQKALALGAPELVAGVVWRASGDQCRWGA